MQTCRMTTTIRCQLNSRSALRTSLSTPSTFIHILVYQLMPHLSQSVSEASITHSLADQIYGDFCHLISKCSIDSSVCSHDVRHVAKRLSRLRELKGRLREICRKIIGSGIFNSHETLVYIRP